jgi:hypothetical protein
MWFLMFASFVLTEGKLGIMTQPVEQFQSREVCEIAKGNFIRKHIEGFVAGEGMIMCVSKEENS